MMTIHPIKPIKTIQPVNTYEKIVCIDPDCEKSGVAEIEITQQQTVKQINLFKLSFKEFILFAQKNNQKKILYIVEKGALIKKSNFHHNPAQNTYYNERIAKNVGMNHQLQQCIVDVIQLYNNEYKEVKPKPQKTTKPIFEKILNTYFKTHPPTPCNQDIIDAFMMCLDFLRI